LCVCLYVCVGTITFVGEGGGTRNTDSCASGTDGLPVHQVVEHVVDRLA